MTLLHQSHQKINIFIIASNNSNFGSRYAYFLKVMMDSEVLFWFYKEPLKNKLTQLKAQ